MLRDSRFPQKRVEMGLGSELQVLNLGLDSAFLKESSGFGACKGLEFRV